MCVYKSQILIKEIINKPLIVDPKNKLVISLINLSRDFFSIVLVACIYININRKNLLSK